MTSLAGKTTSSGKLQRKRGVSTALLFIFLIYSFLPLFYLIVSSTKSNAELFSTFGLWFTSSFHLFSNLQEVFTHDGGIYLTWLWNTAYYSIVSAVGATFLATIAGYAFAKFRFRGRTLLFTLWSAGFETTATAIDNAVLLLLADPERGRWLDTEDGTRRFEYRTRVAVKVARLADLLEHWDA